MKTIVGLFDSFEEAERVARDLEASGFGRNEISVVAHPDALAHGRGEATGAGAAIGAGFGLLAGLAVVAVPGLGIVAAIGPIIAGGLLGAVAGGLVGSLVDAGVPADEAEYYVEGVRRGGTLVTVTPRDEDAPRAAEIMRRHQPVNLNERAMTWRESGWTPGQTADSPASPAAHEPRTPDPFPKP